MSEKVISETTKRTGMIHRKRRAIYLIIRILCWFSLLRQMREVPDP